MAGYKHIERSIGAYIAGHYHDPVEIGIGRNFDAATVILAAGLPVRCTDIHPIAPLPGVTFLRDDVFAPDPAFYTGADVIYAVRPACEMIPPMIGLAARLGCDLLVYHLGFESFGDGGEVIDCGVLLHRYHQGSGTAGKQG
ncbi:MAG TPA: UPF0146 family protein [Methanoregulaceae archaeon]|nr:UPF0146 family protein [Methanoregulaceae archaeon]HRY75282.1 UPF0146 family protein [Methanoregulaceae archaeon]